MRASPGAYTLSLLRARIIDELDLALARARGRRRTSRTCSRRCPTGARSSPGRRASARARSSRADWSPADADGYAALVASAGRRAAERARPLMLEPPTASAGSRRSARRSSTGSIADELAGIPSRGGARAVRDPGPDRHARRARTTRARRSSASTTTSARRSRRARRVGLRARRDGRRDRGAALGGRGGRRARCTSTRRSSACSSTSARRADGVVLEDGAEVARARRALERRPGAHRRARRRRRRRPGWRQPGPVVKVMLLLDGLPDFPSWPGERAVARRDRHRLHARRPRSRRPTTRAPGGRRRGRGSRPRARRRPTRRWRPQGATSLSLFCQCFPADVDAGRGGRRRDRALRRGLPGAARPDRRPARARPASSSRSASGSPAATSSTARCCPGSCSSGASGRGASAASRASTWPARARIPGGAVTGAPGLPRGARGARGPRRGLTSRGRGPVASRHAWA